MSAGEDSKYHYFMIDTGCSQKVAVSAAEKTTFWTVLGKINEYFQNRANFMDVVNTISEYYAVR